MTINIGIVGASGRMGKALIQAVSAAHSMGVVLAGAVVQANNPAKGTDAGILAALPANGVVVSDSLAQILPYCDVIIDFTTPEATMQHAALCAEHNTAMVIGTTGLNETQLQQLVQLSQQTPIVYAANYSVGLNVTLKLLEVAAKTIGNSTDIEIIEAHHKHKVDAPSGTALMMGKAITNAMNTQLQDVAVYAREGIIGPRSDKEIGFQTIRGGDIVGEHTVMFIGEGERIEIKHTATSRMNFASGAVRAAVWLNGRKCGLYDMRDVLNLKDAETI